MSKASEIINKYLEFFKKRNHVQIPNSPLVLANDPTTLFTSSGMQPLVPYLLGEEHPSGNRLVNVQNCFRAQDIDEIGDNRHTTFFRMLGNWSLGDYFKKEQLPWLFEFLTKELELPASKLYVTVFEGYKDVPKDQESVHIWEELFKAANINPEGRIFYYGTDKNWWSRAGGPDKMPAGEPGGPSSEVFYDFNTEHDPKFGENCHLNCDCGRYIEIANSVFMQYKKLSSGNVEPLKQKNVDFGGGLERLLLAVENNPDVFQTSLLKPISESIEKTTQKKYDINKQSIRIVADHFIAACFIIKDKVTPSNKDQGYIVRRLIRRGLDNWHILQGKDINPILESIVTQYKDTDPDLVTNFEFIKNTILEETSKYARTKSEAKKFIEKKYKKIGDELRGLTEISAEDAFILYTTHGLSPTQIKSLGYTFDDQTFAEKMKEHASTSRTASAGKFKGGLADHEEKTIMGHTATHLLHQALRDVLGNHVHQTGSNITTERIRFDFKFDRKLNPDELKQVEQIVNDKIRENLPVRFEMIETKKAKDMGAIGLFMDTYGDKSKIYFIGPSANSGRPYSVEFCGGPHVDFTGRLKRFKILKQESLGNEQKRIYSEIE